jgi:hypothetical protein
MADPDSYRDGRSKTEDRVGRYQLEVGRKKSEDRRPIPIYRDGSEIISKVYLINFRVTNI